MLNEQQHKFCENYVLYKNAKQSAINAGYSSHTAHVQGSRLMKREDILERINDLSDELTTDVDVVGEIGQQYEFAKRNGQTNSALKALELLSKVRGTKRTEPEMDPEELEESIVKYFKIIGKDKMYNYMREAGFGDVLPHAL